MTASYYLKKCKVPNNIKLEKFGRCEVKKFEGMTVLYSERFNEIVADDSDKELKKHLSILMVARGRILLTGLGLGCLVRGFLANPKVEHIDVVEIDNDVIKKFGKEFENNPKVKIHWGDALLIDLPGIWDFIWHNIYPTQNNMLHAKLIKKFKGRGIQGARDFPRHISKAYSIQLLGSPKHG